MSQLIEVKVPDIGDFSTCRSSTCSSRSATASRSTMPSPPWNPTKATMDVPSTVAGVVKEVLVSSAPRSAKDRADQGRTGAQPPPPCPAPAPAAAAPAPLHPLSAAAPLPLAVA